MGLGGRGLRYAQKSWIGGELKKAAAPLVAQGSLMKALAGLMFFMAEYIVSA
jgi:hypothetical protein